MSYEGYEQRLCKNGHEWTDSCYSDATKCPRCGESHVWTHSVNQTNGTEYDKDGKPYPDTIPYPQEIERYEEVTVKIPIYKVPKRGLV